MISEDLCRKRTCQSVRLIKFTVVAIVGQELAKQNIQKYIPYENNLLPYNGLFS